MHFSIRPWLGNPRWAPDFMMLALMTFAIRARPGHAAVGGFVVGIIGDALAEGAFGAGALAHTVVGYLQAWGKDVFFPDNYLVNAGFFFAGVWIRDLLVLLASGRVGAEALLLHLATWSLLLALTTTLAGLVLMALFRDWLRIGPN
jgi:rod shape-determining protein MreD